MTPDVTRSAAIVAVMGASGTGKSAWTKQQLLAGRPDRLLIWDPEGEYTDLAHQVTDPRELMRLAQFDRFALAFYGAAAPELAEQQFAFVCRLAFELASRHGRPITFAADELQEVTKPNRAPPEWAAVVRRGRKFGISVYGIGQRPAEIDKTLFSNASRMHIGRLSFQDDQRTFGAALGVAPAEIAALDDLEYFDRDMRAGTPAVRGRLQFAKPRRRRAGADFS